MGLFFGAVKESFRNPPQPRPTDKVVLNPPKSNVISKAMTTMGRQSFMLAAVAAVYSAGEVRGGFLFSCSGGGCGGGGDGGGGGVTKYIYLGTKKCFACATLTAV